MGETFAMMQEEEYTAKYTWKFSEDEVNKIREAHKAGKSLQLWQGFGLGCWRVGFALREKEKYPYVTLQVVPHWKDYRSATSFHSWERNSVSSEFSLKTTSSPFGFASCKKWNFDSEARDRDEVIKILIPRLLKLYDDAVAYELFSPLSLDFEPVRERISEYLIKHWKHVKESKAWKKVFEKFGAGELPKGMELMSSVIGKV
ncbi:uncharacterized protein JCM6883_006551 [Sporobolomyces salmoneus]|uniref:uncharacterized protein n=1 Tax=Sporobolomyces salmoneus TaxID=183962 RepID=UPI00317B75FC